MKRVQSTTFLLILVAMFAPTVVAQTDDPIQERSIEEIEERLLEIAHYAMPRGELSLSSPEKPLRGEYSVDDSVVVFSAAEQHRGWVQVWVDVNGLVYDAEYDPAGPTVYLDGHDAQLTPRDKLALQELTLRLEMDWQSTSDALPVERHWVLRLVMLFGEAPVGYPLKKRTIHAPVERVAPPGEARPQSDGTGASAL